jgi:transposase
MTAALQQAAATGPASLARFRAERRAEEIRADLKGAAAMLREAREEGDWRELGYASHGAYVLARFGDVLEDLKLATEDRDAVVDAMRTDGASYAKIQRRVGISAGTVRNILDRVGDHAPDTIVGDDGRTRSARTSTPEIARDETPARPLAAGIGRDNHTVKVVTAAGASGLTVHELCKRGRMRQGAASASLSRVDRSGRLVRTTSYRDGCAVYVAAEFAPTTA